MAANKIVYLAVALSTTTTTNLLNLAITSLAGPVGLTLTQPYGIIRQITAGNKTASGVNIALWKGATGANAAGTEFAFHGAASAGALTQGISIPANSQVDRYPNARIDSTDFIVGGASAATAVTLNIVLEIGFS